MAFSGVGERDCGQADFAKTVILINYGFPKF